MAQRKNAWLTPDVDLTPTNISRCLVIPENLLPHVSGALSLLTDVWRWEAYGSMTPEDAAQAITVMLEAFLGNECGDMECCPLRINPANRQLQTSDDGGLTWFDVAEGPWVDDPVISYPAPRVRTGTDDDERCRASYAAARVLQALYRETWDQFITWATRGAFMIAREFADIAADLMSALGLIDEYINIAEDLYAQQSQFINGGFPDGLIDDVQCILYDNASISGGVVTFDHAALIAEFQAVGTTPYPGLAFLLTLWIGEDGLNAAANVDVGSGGDCDCTDAWCYIFNFSTNAEGWTFTGGAGMWIDGGIGALQSVHFGGSTQLTTVRTFTDVYVSEIDLTGNFGSGPGGSPTRQVQWWHNGVQQGSSGFPVTSGSFGFTIGIDDTIDEIRVVMHSLNNAFNNLNSVTVRGPAGTSNPFGLDNC